jgi:hypothetical protein
VYSTLGTGEQKMELNAEEIIKALECLNDKHDRVCDLCPVYKTTDRGHRSCRHIILDEAVALINELTDENERLRADKDYWKNRAKESESEYDQAVKRGYNLGAIDYVGSFAERLKAETITIQDHTGKLGSVVLVSTIDQIAKEMLEGDNGS